MHDSLPPRWIKYNTVLQLNSRLFLVCLRVNSEHNLKRVLVLKQIINVIHDRCFTAYTEMDVAESTVLQLRPTPFLSMMWIKGRQDVLYMGDKCC